MALTFTFAGDEAGDASLNFRKGASRYFVLHWSALGMLMGFARFWKIYVSVKIMHRVLSFISMH